MLGDSVKMIIAVRVRVGVRCLQARAHWAVRDV